jgi:hypothetical protein
MTIDLLRINERFQQKWMPLLREKAFEFFEEEHFRTENPTQIYLKMLGPK